ncbi:AraC family transcriptional regulator [Lactiplantibacillus pentosus]|uniref:AraC family transcriptional regulator n=1 Tax=Lactiplantibacillus pentosus TaxID=1589 RepID=A0ABD7IU07_LACPE|nr:AraC family transcriptional regulator [Lactiplantibacillus pentosus]RMW52294.1 AraC family transcriptional regulator [Lactiplantibacillus pentosus]
MIDQTELTTTFYNATGLSILISDNAGRQLALAKNPLLPEIPTALLTKLIELSRDQVQLLTVINFGFVAVYAAAPEIVIIWAATNAIRANGIYDDKVPLVDLHHFRAQVTLFYVAQLQQTPSFGNEQQLAMEDFAIIDRAPKTAEIEKQPSHAGYLAERKMLLGVEHGNVNEFNTNYLPFMQEGNFGELAASDLRSKKNLTIAATTLFTRAAIRGGLYAENAYNLSDLIIKQSERLPEITNVYEYTRTIGERFTLNVARIKRQSLPTVIYRAQEYIYDHLATLTNVATLAEQVQCSPSYLMHLFKASTGVSVMQFITEQRILSAKQLLIFTQEPISEIAATLGYPNQAQLAHIFKQNTGLTPTQFRKSQQL